MGDGCPNFSLLSVWSSLVLSTIASLSTFLLLDGPHDRVVLLDASPKFLVSLRVVFLVKDLFDGLSEQLETIGTDVLQIGYQLVTLSLLKLDHSLSMGPFGHHVAINTTKIDGVFFLERVRVHK